MSTRISLGRKSGRLSRNVVRVALVAVIAAIVPLLFALIIRHRRMSVTPEELYHRVWEETQSNIYDPASLGDWKKWEHLYAGKLKTTDDATKAIDEMLGSVHDRYTYMYAPVPSTTPAQPGEGDAGTPSSPVPVSDATSKHLPAGIGYLLLASFGQPRDVDEFKSSLQDLSDCRGIVIDLRFNRGGLVDNAIAISSMFLDTGTIVSIRQRIPEAGYEKRVYRLTPESLVVESAEDGSSKAVVDVRKRQPNLLGRRPAIVLVNGDSASATELAVGALKDNGRVTVLGTRTFGKGIGTIDVQLPSAFLLHITVLRYYTPRGDWLGDGGNSESHGIEPDIVVAANAGMQMGTDSDNQLQEAFLVMEKKLADTN